MPFAFIKNPLISLPSVEVDISCLLDDDLIISIHHQQIFVVEATPLIATSNLKFVDKASFLQLGKLNQQRLFVYNDVGGVLGEKADAKADESADNWWGLRRMAQELPADLASIAAQAYSISHWHRHHQFCSKCGSKSHLGNQHSRVCINDHCGEIKFPRIDPSMIVSVVNDNDEILLGHQAAWGEGRYSVLAGFLSHGESLEQCVKREVKEEAGIVVDSVEYVASQPWPFPGSLMIGFHAKAKNQTIKFEDDELQDAIWISRQALREKVESQEIILSNRLSISRYLVDRWLGDL